MVGRVILAVIAGVAMLAPCQELKAETAHGAVINGAKYNFGAEPWSIEGKFHKQEVSLASPEKPGTIIISTSKRFLYLVLGNGMAMRYGIGVGRVGFIWTGGNRSAARPNGRTGSAGEMRARDPDLPAP